MTIESWSDLRLAQYLLGPAITRAIADYGAPPVPPLTRPDYALAAAIKKRRVAAGLTGVQVARLIDLYVATPNWWISGTHPAWGFVTEGAFSRVADLAPYLAEYGRRTLGGLADRAIASACPEQGSSPIEPDSERNCWLDKAGVRGRPVHEPSLSSEFYMQVLAQAWRQDALPVGPVIWGPPSSGRTSLAIGLLAEFLKTAPPEWLTYGGTAAERPGLYLRFADLVASYRYCDAQTSPTLDIALCSGARAQWSRILVLDDVGEERWHTSGVHRTALEDTVRSRHDKGAVTVLVSHLKPDDWLVYGPSLASYLRESHVIAPPRPSQVQ